MAIANSRLHFKIALALALRGMGDGAFRPTPRRGRVAFHDVSAVKQHGQHLHRKGMSQLGGSMQRLVGVGTGYQLRLVEVAAFP